MKQFKQTILVIDDDQNDRILIGHAFEKGGITDPIHILSNGGEALDYLDGKGQYADRKKYAFPTMLITDLKMPRMSGFDILQHLKQNPQWTIIPTIMLSASTDSDDIKQAYVMGVVSYFTKPQDFDELTALLKRIHGYWQCADVPEIDEEGEMLPTDRQGKLSEKFSPGRNSDTRVASDYC